MTGPVHYHEGKFPPSNLDWQRLIPLLGPANAAVARYEGSGRRAAVLAFIELLNIAEGHEAF